MRASVVTAATILFFASAALASEELARKSVSMLAKWQCATWAEMMGDEEKNVRLQRAGLEDGRKFVRAALSGEVTDEEANRNVPVIVLLTMQGYNEDFILGRLFEAIISDAYSDIVEKDERGLPLPPSEYNIADEHKKILAEEKFHSSNCDIL